jgi:sugar phosphate isomerase/epimerase
MAVKLAFSTVACPKLTLQQVVQKAAEWGYQGVELRTLGGGASLLANDPALTDAAKVRDIFVNHGVEPVCLSTSLALHHEDRTVAYQVQRQIRSDLEMAAKIGCRHLRVFGHDAVPGQNRSAVIQRIARQIAPLADRAGELGLQILFENAGGFNTAKDWWWLFNLIEHPMVGMCWNVASAAAAGESPAVSVPMLHSRIHMAKVKDTIVGEGSGFVPLGEGTVGIEHFVKRLLGIGFDKYISVEWDHAWLPSLAPGEEYLPQAREKLSGWLDAIAQEIKQAQEKGAKATSRK